MKNYENELLKVLRKLNEGRTITFSMEEFSQVESLVEKVALKIAQQREELETSRDNWRKRYFKLKEEFDKK